MKLSPLRTFLAIPGLFLIGYGIWRLLHNIEIPDLLSLSIWLVAALIIHDGLIAPLTLGIGKLTTLFPLKARRYVQGWLITSAMITVIALPLIYRQGSQPAVKTLLVQNYGENLVILLFMTALVTSIAYVFDIYRTKKAYKNTSSSLQD